MNTETTEMFVKRTKTDFNIVFDEPNIEREHAERLAAIEALHIDRIEVYQNHYGTTDFKKMIGLVGGKISGQIRSHRNDLMIEILKDIHQKSPKSFTKFTLTAWRELALALFANSPAKQDLLVLLNDEQRTTGKRLTPNGWNPEYAVNLLLVDHQKTVKEIRDFHDDYVSKFHDETQQLKQNTNDEIEKIKGLAA